jgi:hypothetical protein
MLRENCIFAQYGPKEKIDVVERGDVVFLYENRVGIIAYGFADGKLIIRDYEGYEDEEHRMHVDEYRILKDPFKPKDVSKLSRKLASIGVFFARTVSPLRPKLGEALYQQIKKQPRRT